MTDAITPDQTFLTQWLTNMAHELDDLAEVGPFTGDWLTDGSFNRQSWLHSRIFGVMVRAVPRPFIPLIEVKWHQSFIPDLCVVDNKDIIVAVIEYESTNSSDERLMDKDINHYEEAIIDYVGSEPTPADPDSILPAWWVIVSTLPNCPVRGWSWWAGYNDDTFYPPPTKDKALRNKNPLAYYEAGLHQYLGDSWQRIVKGFGKIPPCQLVWVNLTPQSIDIKNKNGEKLAQPTSFPLHLSQRRAT